ncbi:DUF4276 family protein [Candidatus Magnetaquicoccus inordinatus]|uniref:DUF4276 family protein n=1 Tax=Candidatus Magnetaquicoccus inordinatus TaxID=2496818 RepID=UPI00102B0219|nr:DUF4276 family protein [Candidatus Magnetaquicoccus inordinatus]
MHFEILVEGQADHIALAILLPKIIGSYRQPHTWKIHPHRGVGKVPEDLFAIPHVHDRSLLHNLPSKLRSYGRELQKDEMVVVLLDLDERTDCRHFKEQLTQILTSCNPAPKCLFRIAIRELESWFFADPLAIKSCYPAAHISFLQGTLFPETEGGWEELALLIPPPDGMTDLPKKAEKRSARIGDYKVRWAKKITPFMDVERNWNDSFIQFRDGLRKFAR